MTDLDRAAAEALKRINQFIARSAAQHIRQMLANFRKENQK
jgi:hypothetical protein